MKTKIPNNPMRAYMRGKLDGTRENMDMVAMVLCDKCGFHVLDSGDDRQSIEYLYDCIIKLTEEINSGLVTRKDIKETIADEYKTIFDD